MAEETGNFGQMKAADASTNDSSLSRKSTGPRTPKGKERTKYNAVKHGIFCKVAVLKGEPRAVFDALLNGFTADRQPQGALEEILVEKLGVLAWRYRRVILAEAEARESDGLLDIAGTFWTADHLLRYEASIERSFDRTLSQLERAQRMRLGLPVPPAIKLDISSDVATHPGQQICRPE